MRRRRLSRPICILSLAAALAAAGATGCRAEPDGGRSGATIIADGGFRQWVEALWPEAGAAAVSRRTFDSVFKTIAPDCALPGVRCPASPPGALPPADEPQPQAAEGLPESCNKISQSEFLRPSEYFPADYLDDLVARGQGLLYKWRTGGRSVYASLLRVQKRYGVSRHVLMALWGRETSFGDVDDEHNAVRALASLAYAGPEARRPWFRGQLVAALKMVDAGNVPLKDFTSSYAGATGLTQIMPEEFLAFAADGDGDSRKDIWRSAPDSLATTANILEHRGWSRAHRKWGYEVEAPEGRPLDCTLEGRTETRPIRAWIASHGLRRIGPRPGGGAPRRQAFSSRDLNAPAYLVTPAGARGPAFLVTPNFDVLKSYNPAELYALFIGHVADRLICDQPGKTCAFAHPWPAAEDDFPFSVENLCRLQIGLQARGFLTGAPDGLFGPQTRVAIGRFQKASGRAADCYPNSDLFKTLAGGSDRDVAAGVSSDVPLASPH